MSTWADTALSQRNAGFERQQMNYDAISELRANGFLYFDGLGWLSFEQYEAVRTEAAEEGLQMKSIPREKFETWPEM